MLWGETHEAELKLNKTKVTDRNSGLAWVSSMTKIIWDHLYRMWLARNADRHGHGEAERKNREWERNIREVRMWYKLKDDGRLDLDEDEKKNWLNRIN